MRLQHPADAPAADCMAPGLHFGAYLVRAVALAVVRKRFGHGYLPGRLGRWHLLAALLSIAGGRGHAQHLAELAHRHAGCALGNVLAGAHQVG